MLFNIKIIFFVKNAWQNSSYEKKDKIVTSYRTTKTGRKRNGFLLIKYENIISQTEWPTWHINIYIYIYIYIYFQNSILKILQKVVAIMENAKNKYLNGVKHDRTNI